MSDDLHTLIERFMAQAQARGIRPGTTNHYGTALKRLERFLGVRPINRATLRAFLRHLQADPQIRPTTAESYWRAVGTFCSWLVKSGVMEEAPPIARGLSLPRHVPAGDDSGVDVRAALPGSPADLAEQFIDARIAKGLSPKTIDVYRDRMRWFLDWLEDRPLTRATVRAYLVSLQQRDRPLAPSTVASLFRDVKGMLQWAVDEGLIDGPNPAKGLTSRVPHRRIASYSKEQITQMLAVCDLRDRAIVVTMLDTGLRAGELVSLDRTIDLTTGIFDVVGKGQKTRACFLSPYTCTLLRAYLATRTDCGSALFVGREGKRLALGGVYQTGRRRAVEAGIRGEVRRLVHSMRATFAKNFSKRGGSLDTLADLLGHSTLEMSRHYAALNQEELGARKATVNPLAAMLDEAG